VAIPPLHARPVTTLATLGDSTTVGIGDPAAGGGWRGFPKLLQAALGASTLVNPARPGARMRAVLHEQVPLVVAARPQVAVVFVGMNDTLRSDFDPAGMSADGAAVIGALHAVGAQVLLVRYHDHTQVFHLPAPLRRALLRRIAQLNAVMDGLAVADGVSLLDAAALPGVYDRTAWAVDRLHPSELGHRMLAAGFSTLIAEVGFAVPHPVGLQCAGGREITAAHRLAWLIVKGIPWLVKRGSDLGPVIVQGLMDELGRSGSGSGSRA